MGFIGGDRIEKGDPPTAVRGPGRVKKEDL